MIAAGVLDTAVFIASGTGRPFDESAMRLRVHLAETGRRMGVNELWIAAIAVARGLPVTTQDDDFAALEGASGFAVIRV